MVKSKKLLERVAALPWRTYLVVLYTSFGLASLTSMVIGFVLFPGDGLKTGSNTTTNAGLDRNPDKEIIPKALATLTDKDLATILERNVFNSDKETEEDPDKVKVPEPEKPTDEISKSDLAVKLHGTIYGGDPFSGIAMVENTQQRKINSVMVGEALTDDTIVAEILRERIIIDRGGRKEYIEVERPEVKDRRRRGDKKPKQPAEKNTVAPIAVEPPPEVFKEEGFEREKGRIEMTESYRDKLLTQDFAKVLQDAKATPNMVDGQLKGFKLTRIRQESIYEKAGLQNDDVIEEINGVPLTDTAQAIRLLQSLRQEREIEVRIMRGGGYQTVTLNIR